MRKTDESITKPLNIRHRDLDEGEVSKYIIMIRAGGGKVKNSGEEKKVDRKDIMKIGAEGGDKVKKTVERKKKVDSENMMKIGRESEEKVKK